MNEKERKDVEKRFDNEFETDSLGYLNTEASMIKHFIHAEISRAEKERVREYIDLILKDVENADDSLLNHMLGTVLSELEGEGGVRLCFG